MGALAATLAATRPDIVHINLVDPASNRPLLEAAHRLDAATVATCHMVGALPDPVGLGRVYGGLDAVIAVSSEIAALLCDGLRLGEPAVDVVHPGVRPFPVRETVEPGTLARIGGLGRLSAQKGFDVLITATTLLLERGLEVEVEVAGDGRARALQREARTPGRRARPRALHRGAHAHGDDGHLRSGDHGSACSRTVRYRSTSASACA